MANIIKNSQSFKRTEKAKILWGIVEKYMSIQKVSPVELAHKINVGQATVYNWKRTPSKITIENFLRIADALKIPEEELAEVFGGKK